MQITAQTSYPASPEAVFAMLTDETFLHQVCEATGATSHSVDVQLAGGGATVSTRRDLPTEDVPDFAKRFVGETLTVTRVDVWGPAAADGGRHGTLTVEIAGAPVRLTGTLALAADAQGTVEQVDGDLKASVPLVGGKIEKAAEPAMRSGLRQEQQLGTAWLTR